MQQFSGDAIMDTNNFTSVTQWGNLSWDYSFELICLLVFAKDYIIFLTEIYDMHYVHTLRLWYTLTYVRAAPFLALIPDEVGILLKFYETYIKLWFAKL